MTVPALRARGLTLVYDAPSGRNTPRPVLDRIDLEIAAGELVAILGASGSGKSSLLRLLAGLQSPASGTVELLGTPLMGTHPHIAIAFQESDLLPWLSVEKNVVFGLDFARRPRLTREQRERRIAHALEQMELSNFRKRFPSEISGGMAQRTVLARCLAREPKVLLLDEPFAALDEVTRAQMQQLLLRVIGEGRVATALVTHDIDEALLVADRIVLLGHEGRLVASWHVTLPQPRSARIAETGVLRIEILKALICAKPPSRVVNS